MPLEKYLSTGNHIVIGHFIPREAHFRASFISGHGKKQRVVSVESQRHAQHLLLLLEAAIEGKKALCHEADQRFPYALSWNAKTEVESLLEVSYVHIFGTEQSVYADCYQFRCVSGEPVPGLYKQSGRGATVLEALTDAAKSEKFQRTTCMPILLSESHGKEKSIDNDTSDVIAA